MRNPVTYRRRAAAFCLVTTALLSAVSVALAPEYPGGSAERLAAISAGGNAARLSAIAFTLSQLPFIVAVAGIAHLLADRAPVLSNLGVTFAVVGGFGHSVFGGLSLAYVAAADDAANRSLYGGLVTAIESGPAVVFMMMGLAGTVLGILLLAVGLWRAKVAPRWVGPVLGAFLVAEFAGSALSDWSSHLAVALYLAAFTALAVTVWRTPDDQWGSSRIKRVPAVTVT